MGLHTFIGQYPTAHKLKKDTLIIYWYDETEVLLKKK